jgi:two-component system, sensor histidine kinase and response regulator
MERAITWIASLVAVAIMLLLPAGYFALHYLGVQSELRLETETNARAFTQLINAAPDMWQFQADRIEEILARRPSDGTPESRRVRNAQARVIAESNQLLDEPIVSASQPIFDAGREVGHIEIERSLRPAVLGSGMAFLLGAFLAGTVFAVLRLLPMRALRRAERKVAEQELHTAFLEKAHREAAEEARIKTHFLARLTHEIRTPLGGLLGMTDTLRSSPMSAAQRRQAQRAHESGAALLQVVNDIFDYSKLQSDEVVVARESFDPMLLVESVIEVMTPNAEASGLTLYYQVGPNLPAEMEGDPGRLRQVLTNLVGNALKFTPRGEVKVLVSWVAATVSAPAAVYFEVRDSGVGISPEDQARLFQPVIHADPATSLQRGGTGLGLTISRQLVQLMGGELSLQSQVGRGAKFWFELPQEQRHIVPSTALPAEASGGLMHALVADPHTGRARALCTRLLALGVRVNAVHNAGALRTVLAKPRNPFTHVLALASLKVDASEARQLRWITMFDNTQQGFDWSEEPGGMSLNLPCRRDDLVQALLGAQPLADAADVFEPTVAPEEAPSHTPQRPAPSARRGGAPTVLLVEGNSVSQEMGRALLESMGCTVHVADDGHEALQRLPQGFGLILLDLQMAGMDGYTTAREIRRWEGTQPEARRTPLVALTADGILDVQERCDAAGMDDIVAKPVNLEALRETLERYLPELAAA